MVIFARLIWVYAIKYTRAFQAWRINVKDELFIHVWEWGKQNVLVPFSDKDLSEI